MTCQSIDAFCPHLGAHLGYGGLVEESTIRCPFHAWRFDGTGACVEVPYVMPAKWYPPSPVYTSACGPSCGPQFGLVSLFVAPM